MVPASQGVQVVLPAVAEKLPAGHAVQLPAPAALVVPAGQELHVVAPGAAKVPAAHWVHAVEPAVLVAVPAAQGVQAVAAPAE